MNILLVSAYHAQSHKYWCDGLMQSFPEYNWKLLSLPPRYFAWHMRGNALIWSQQQKEVLKRDYDLIIATSMTDLHGLRGFVTGLADIPSILFFHENQFSYPTSEQGRHQIELQLVSVYSALCADKVVFNSDYNYKSFSRGLRKLLKKLPDYSPVKIITEIEQKTSILPVPLKSQKTSNELKSAKKFTLVWNHRWEFDKWPENFHLALLKLKERKINFSMHVLGQQFRHSPKIFNDLKHEFEDCIESWGMIEDEQHYRDVLSTSHIVISTALHDFQGLAIQEAVACGCLPVVPDRLAYPQFFREKYRYASYTENNELQATVLADHITDLYRKFQNEKLAPAPSMEVLSWPNMKYNYQQMFEDVCLTKKEMHNVL